MKNVVYITSAKKGLHRFTLNELKLLEEHSINFHLCVRHDSYSFLFGNYGRCGTPCKGWTIPLLIKSQLAENFR